MRLDALAQVVEFIWLVETQGDGGLKPDRFHCRQLPPAHVEQFAAHDAGMVNQLRMMGNPERDQELCDLVCGEVEALPPRLRDAVEAHVFQHMGSRRIARLDWIDRQVVTVNKNLNTGLRILRSRLGDHPIIKEWLGGNGA